MKLTALSALAESFPTVQVEYEDLMQYRYVPDARGHENTIDCLGIVLEVYRRAGLLLPDPRDSGSSVTTFYALFNQVPDPDTLYDLIHLRRDGQDHLWVVVRPGLVLSVRRIANVITRKTVAVMTQPGTIAYRVKPECLP